MITIELIYERDCPNVSEARSELLLALSEVGLPLRWVEWERSDPDSPNYVKTYGSPTILVNGKDVAGINSTGVASCCRLYVNESGKFKGAPHAAIIVKALRSALESEQTKM